MLFRKNTLSKIDDVASKISIDSEKMLEIPDLNCKIAEKPLKLNNGEAFNFAEAQLLTKKLSKTKNLDIRMPKTIEGYLASQKLGIKNQQYEWRSELIDGSFLMLNPDVRLANNPRIYDFCSNKTSLVGVQEYRTKDNGNLRWLGISRDKYDRAAVVSNSDNEKYSVCAIPPLSKDYLDIRLLIDENKNKKD